MREESIEELFKISVSVGGQPNMLFEGFEFEQKLWFVPCWHESPDKKTSKPVRIVRFDNLEHSDLRTSQLRQIFLQTPMPTIFFDPKPLTRTLSGIEHLEAPDIVFEGNETRQ